MTEPSSMKNWQVEESTDPNDQWQLLETEQELPKELTLEEDAAQPQNWQPVEYVEPKSSGGRNWILPSFIILAMIAVVTYIVWLALNGDGLFPQISSAVDPTPLAVDPVVTAAETTPTIVPTATPEPEPTATAIPTAVPTPTAELVQQRFATIDSEYGLNARLSPDPDAEVVEILENGTKFAVSQVQGDRLELILDDGRKVWVSADFVIESVEEVLRENAPGLIETEDTPQGEAPTGETPADGSAGEVQSTERTGITPPEPFTDLVPPGPALLVLVEGGVNARTAGSTDSDIILTIPQGAALSALSQDAGGEWLQTELPNGAEAWVFKDTIETRGAVESLPIVDPNAAEIESETDTAAEPVADTEAITSTEPIAEATPVEAVVEDVDPEITVGLIGVKARTSPELGADVAEVLASGTVLPATGRTADNAWVAVTGEDGDVFWVLVGTVELNVDPATLPVVEP